MEAMKIKGKSILKPAKVNPFAKLDHSAEPGTHYARQKPAERTQGKSLAQAPIKGGTAGLTFDTLRALRGMLISYYDSLMLNGQCATAYDVNIRLQEVIKAMKGIS